MNGLFQKIFGELRKNDISFYCLLFVLTAAIGGGFVFSVPLQILCLFVLLFCFSFLFINKSFKKNDIFIIALPLIAIFISYLGADFQTNVRTASLGFLNAVLAFFIISYSNPRNKENILITLVIFAVWVSLIIFAQVFSNAMILNVNIAAGFLILAYPLCFAFVEKNKYSVVFLLTALLIFAAVIIAKSWPAVIIVYLISFFYFIRLRKAAKIKIFFTVVSLFVLGGIIYVFKAKTGGQSLEDAFVWQKTAFLMFKDNLFFGIGYGNFGALFAYYRPEFVLDTLFTRNIFFQLLAETGIVGILAFIAAAFVFVKNVIASFARFKNQNNVCLPEPCHSGLVNIHKSSNKPAPYGLNTGESILPLSSSNKSKDNVDTGFHRYDKTERLDYANFEKNENTPYIISCAVGAAAFIVLNFCDYSFFIPANTIAFFIICGAAFNVEARPRNSKLAAVLILIPAAALIYVFLNVLIADNYFKQANILKSAGNLKEAKEKYLEALKYDAKNADYWYSISENAVAERNYKDAAEYLLNAEKYYKYSSQIKAEAAYLYKISGDDENAAKYAKLAKEYDKFNPFLQKIK